MELETTQTAPAAAEQPAVATPAIKPPKKKRKWKKPVIITLVIVALIFFFVIRPMLSAGQQLLSGAYLSDTAAPRDITVAVSSTGTITPIDSYQVTALVRGEVLEAPFEEGDIVSKDDLLFRIDSSDAENTIQRAQLALDQANLAYEDALRSQKDLNLASTAAGTVQTLYVEQGDSISAGDPIADIVDRDTLTLKVPFHSQSARNFYVGQAATVSVNGYSGTFSGQIREISGADTVDAGGALVRTVTIEAANPGAVTENDVGAASVEGVACAGTANFTYRENVRVVSKVTGDVGALYVKEGDRVTDGQALGQVTGSATASQIENCRIAAETARLSLQSAVDALDDYTITSPISGTVIEKNFKAGDNVDSSNANSTYMAIIYDMSTLTFDMKIDEKDINKIQVGQEVTITADAVEGVTYTGYVDKVNINGTTVSGMTTYPITVVIENPDGLKPGMNVSADVIVERAGTVLSVPVEAVERGTGTPVVTVIPASALDANGYVQDISQAEQRQVTLGRNDDKYIEITSGLSEGDIVIWPNEASNLYAMLMGM